MMSRNQTEGYYAGRTRWRGEKGYLVRRHRRVSGELAFLALRNWDKPFESFQKTSKVMHGSVTGI